MKNSWGTILLIGLLILIAGCASSAPPSLTQEQENTGPSIDSPAPAPSVTQTPEPLPENMPTVSPPAGEIIPTTSLNEFDGLTPRVETSLIFQALDDAGINDAAVDFQTDKVLVAFNLPAGMTIDGAAYFTLGLVSKFAAPAQIIWVQVFSGSTTKTYSVKAETVQKYTAGKLNDTQIKLAVTVQ